MRYLVTLKVLNQPTTPPPAELMEAITMLGEEATRAGALLDNGGLAPRAEGARVELAGGKLTVTDGPFAEAKEMISYALYQTRSKEETIEWTSRFLKLHRDHWEGWEGEAEVLRVFGPEDFAAPS
ncbi:YciI family protein [Streptosporangium sp. NPDC050855]|uniref:YciI family protein n=1 Tax=Streptosporangium sp. NPDC050855 TaxID=3366194 RepID=UPI0037B71518